MGGEAGVSSTPERGSSFWFEVTLPGTAGNPEPSAAPLAPPQTATRGPTAGILLVEDNATNRAVVKSLLGKHGYQVSCAQDGQEAVELLTGGQVQPDLLLMDCQMPRLDGFAATRQIRAWETANQRLPLPIVALTAGAFAEDRQRCLDCGMNDFLTKPIDSAELLKCLRNHLGDHPLPGHGALTAPPS